MRLTDFDYELPADRIAQTPVERGASRMMMLPSAGEPTHHRTADLPELIEAGDVLVVNNTRVLRARLFGRRSGGGRAELLLIEPKRVEQDIQGARDWWCLGKPRKRMPPGATIRFAGGLNGTVREHVPPDRLLVEFSAPPAAELERQGHVPLPPYIQRSDSPQDTERYQTVYARVPGAVAAPTAGLHFDEKLLAQIEARGVNIAQITLHVGPGTFRPVTAENIEEHRMDAERFHIDREAATTIESARQAGGRVVAVGTTVVRTLETVAAAHQGRIVAASGSSELFIRPGDAENAGFQFRAVELLLTNFHLPRSTLLMLVSAFAGTDRVRSAYQLAIDAGYRFYSYGDAMLLERQLSDRR